MLSNDIFLSFLSVQSHFQLKIVAISHLDTASEDFEWFPGKSALPHGFGRDSGPRRTLEIKLDPTES